MIIDILQGPLGFFIGVLGGVSAHFIGNWIWNYYSQPALSFRENARATFETNDEGDPHARLFRIQVENEGRKAALNCKPEYKLRGTLDGNEYEIESNLCWAEGTNPSRVIINQNEVVSFDLFKMTIEQSGTTISASPTFYIQFPNENLWEDNTTIIKWIKNDNGEIVNADFPDRLELSDFLDINWDIQEVRVTSKNASMVESTFSISHNVEDERGLVGISLDLD